MNAQDTSYTLSDLGNAERFSAQWDKVSKFVPELNMWRVWNGRQWEEDEALVRMRWLASLTVRKIYEEAAMYETSAEREVIAKHALRSESERSIKGMITLAASEPNMTRDVFDWDCDPWLLNVANGTVDLRTGELREHRREDFLTGILPTEYDPAAECPLWHKFLDRATDNDAELKAYLQKAAGYCMTGDTREQVFFFVYGLGNNGKSVFVKTLRQLMGGHATRVSTDLFMVKDKASNGHKEGLANLRGKRLVIASELEDGKHLATSLIKDLTGGESIRADRKYHHEIEFQPLCKLWLVGNHEPVIKDTTLSIWRRVKKIPFTVTIPESEIDMELGRKLEAEYPGILAWAVQGCLLWQREGLREPEAVKLATSTYRDEQDILKDFISEYCLLDPQATITVSELYKAYKSWCEGNDQPALGKKKFGGRLIERGLYSERGTGNKMTWHGIRLLSDEEVTKVTNVTDFPETSHYARARAQEREGNPSFVTFTSEKSYFSTEKVTPPYPEKPCGVCGGINWTLNRDCTEYLCVDCKKEAADV